MTKEQKQEALAALDTYAAIFGPRLTSYADFCAHEGNGPFAEGCCCAIGALGINDAQIRPSILGGDIVFDWRATAVRFGFRGDVEVFAANDRICGTPEERFTRMRKWVEDYPTTD